MGHSLMGKAALIGFSMGGYGALKLALRRPEAFAAVAALCPVIFPADIAADVPARNRPSILGDLNAAMGADAHPSVVATQVAGTTEMVSTNVARNAWAWSQ